MTQIIPAEHDARQFEIICWASVNSDKLDSVRNLMHRLAGDRKQWIGRSQVWNMGWAEVRNALRILIEDGDKRDMSYGVTPSQLLAQEAGLLEEIARLNIAAGALEAVWQAERWTRYFPCLNGNGHIHSSLSGCKTVNRNGKATSMGWATELSGKPVAQAIQMPPAGLGPRLCSVCFPDAPVEHCRTLSDITREQRAADKLAKQAERNAAAKVRAERQAARDAKAALPRKETPQERRSNAMRALGERFRPVADCTREEVATAISELASLGKSEKWQDAIIAWAKAVRNEDNDITWAFSQYSVYAAYAI